MKELVSVIIPVYNSEKYIEETLKCLINQTYYNWEAILVDDCSKDNSEKIIQKQMILDNRINYYKLKKNSGAAIARNFALEKCKGNLIAYLDSDDLWEDNKLKTQVEFMKINNYGFTCTSYEVIDEFGKPKNKIIRMPEIISYKKYLGNTIIQTVGVMIDINLIDKKLLVMPNIKRRQDAATWCQILKKGHICYGLENNISKYRKVSNSLSSNKYKAAKGTWFLYRKIEKINLLRSCIYFIGYSVNAIKKRIYIK